MRILSIFYKYYQYSKERFPLGQFFFLSLILAGTASVAVQKYFNIHISALTVALSISALLFFLLRLRLFDEFKDASHDLRYHPDRPVPRGLITLQELKPFLMIGFLLEILISLYFGINSCLFFAIAFLYSLLMFKEFFVSKWLKARFTLYIFTHELLIIPLFFYLYTLNKFTFDQLFQPYFWLLTGFLGLQLFLLEVTRKIKAPPEENAGRDSYTAQYGIIGAGILVALLSLGIIIFNFFLLKSVPEANYYLAFTFWIILLAVFFLIILNFIKLKTSKAAKTVFNCSIVYIVLTDLIFLLYILR